MPLAHISLPVTDLQASKAFYLAILKPLGYQPYMEFDTMIGLGPKNGNPDFWIHKHPDEEEKKTTTTTTRSGGKPQAKTAQKTHVAFQAPSRGAVHAFHEISLKAGATCNGPPGERKYTKGYYAAYVLDLDGNNIEAVHWRPWWLVALQGAPMVVGAVIVGGVSWWAGNQGWVLSV